jgi:hypothetical protein
MIVSSTAALVLNVLPLFGNAVEIKVKLPGGHLMSKSARLPDASIPWPYVSLRGAEGK